MQCNVSTGSIRDGTDYRDADPVHAGYAYNQRAAIAYTHTDTFKEEMKARALNALSPRWCATTVCVRPKAMGWSASITRPRWRP